MIKKAKDGRMEKISMHIILTLITLLLSGAVSYLRNISIDMGSLKTSAILTTSQIEEARTRLTRLEDLVAKEH